MNLKYASLIFFAAVALASSTAFSARAQDIPAGVRYKKTTDAINQKAKGMLENILNAKADAANIESVSDGAIACGPLLWRAIKDTAGKELQGATPMMLIVNAKPMEGRGISTPEQKRAFWKLFIEKVKANNTFKVRKAEAAEISYFWATIPFDIEEPLQIIDFGTVKVLVNSPAKKGEPKIFWMDIVGSLKPPQ